MRAMYNLRRGETKKGVNPSGGKTSNTHTPPPAFTQSHTSNGEGVILLSPAEPVALETEGRARRCLGGLTFSGHD